MAPRIVIVTDRVQLDDQIWKTFGHCGLEPERARSGRHLIELLRDEHIAVITTIVDKFEAAMNAGEVFDSSDIVVLVDEGHRSHYGTLSARMQRTLPNACYVGLTGTPLMKRDKSTVARFGGLIHTYTIRQAEQDKAVVPLFYEGRYVDQEVD
ncbi:MAG: DEAD/DEAH box helicase family protein, partial [Gemmatimonadaceae bacterium]